MADAQQSHKYGQAGIVLENDLSKLSVFEHDAQDSFKRKTKIICTMGPTCWDVETLVKMIDAGMNIARLNFSHGDHEAHGATVERIREAAKQQRRRNETERPTKQRRIEGDVAECELPNKPVAILLDTKGPEIRTGFFRKEVGDKIELVQGQDLKLVTDYSFKGDSTCFAVSYPKLPTSVKPGGIILCADGSLSLTVKECGTDFVICEVMNSVKLGERKNCNLPGVKVELPVLQEKDVKDLVEFGIPHAVDFVAASFVQSAEDVQFIRKTLGDRGRSIKIISKIENEEGVKNIDSIIEESDGIMVARGDLGMEIPPEKVFLAQKMMIAKCNLQGKPVITATQMLESMTSLPRPTRAEASDVANAVLDGTDCVMLSGETAGGAFPLNAVNIMRRICEEAEAVLDYRSIYLNMRLGVVGQKHLMPTVESICSSAVKATLDSECPLIIALTETGYTARLIAKYRPQATILAISASETTVQQLLCVRGVVPVLTASFVGTDSVIKKALVHAKAEGMVSSGDTVVAIHGQKEECPGASNLMKMVTVP
uniref:Pyruvate kinase n=1 Tax=Noctiluca scintillans TaxID=2966 RepID=A0A7S1B1A8_NOCSC